jgi:hypothetical protein
MSLIESYRFALYALALVFAIVCSSFLFSHFFYPFEFLTFLGIDPILIIAVLFSCAYHWRQQSENSKILINVGRIFFWSLFAMKVLFTIQLIFSSLGGGP